MKTIFLLILITLSLTRSYSQNKDTVQVKSPDGKVELKITTDGTVEWAVEYENKPLIDQSPISLQLATGEVLGRNGKLISAKKESRRGKFKTINYKKDSVDDNYEQVTLAFRGNYSIVFRAYNDGIAYRFVTAKKDSITIKAEEASFNFYQDHVAFVPYVNDPHNNDVFETSFENNYQHIRLSQVNKDTLAFLPILIEAEDNVKMVITEADLEEYAGMFVQTTGPTGLRGVFAPYPVEEKQGGHNNLQSFVTKRADYLAKTTGARNFPWRVVIISKEDKSLLNNDMVYRLASPSRLTDVSWIKPGKVAWDWWNDWNISKVDFKAGINTATYKHYIDFASANKIEYILLDEGWASSDDIMKIVPGINLQEIINYGKSKNVGVWLWGGWLPLDKQIDHALKTYSGMGIKGFKIDFMDRDDQKMVQFFYRFAKKAAEYKLMVDYHGAYKPTGLQRTFPNIVNFEGVRGLENVKWSNTDFPSYDCTIPFIRMIAGPMDYTPGAMKNANKDNFRSVYSAPMSQGTRCHQLALYVVFESPFAMLSDNPTNYMNEKESTDFIAAIPTTFDRTIAVEGKVSEYAAIARRRADTWYVGAITNWDERDLVIDLSFLGGGTFEAEIFQDGINANREATDYKKVVRKVSSTDKLQVHLAKGGGWAARIYPVR
jgi:alpha-glucosidase